LKKRAKKKEKKKKKEKTAINGAFAFFALM
jgi:hypothetical protein